MTRLRSDDSTRSGAPLRNAPRPIVIAVATFGLALGAASPRCDRAAWAEEPVPQPSGAAVTKLPMLTAQGPTTKVEGKIARSSRGRKGPVRLLIEREGKDPVTILVAADDYCDRVGLSLKTGETISVEGAMIKGERQILLATSITADGKTVRIRDAAGKLIDVGGTGAAPSSGATLGGGKPASDGAKAATGATAP